MNWNVGFGWFGLICIEREDVKDPEFFNETDNMSTTDQLNQEEAEINEQDEIMKEKVTAVGGEKELERIQKENYFLKQENKSLKESMSNLKTENGWLMETLKKAGIRVNLADLIFDEMSNENDEKNDEKKYEEKDEKNDEANKFSLYKLN